MLPNTNVDVATMLSQKDMFDLQNTETDLLNLWNHKHNYTL